MPAALGAALGLLLAALPAAAQAPSACGNTAVPCNDNYLASYDLNGQSPKDPLNSTDTLVDKENLADATTQTDIFSPPNSGGPAEVTGCAGQPEEHTVWYDFYPQANGLVQVQTSATFGTVIAMMPFNTSTLQPDTSARTCKVNAVANAQTYQAYVKPGTAYTIQVGSEGAAAGPVEMKFDYYITAKVTASATLEAVPLSTGVKLVGLTVQASKGSSVRVACTRGCRAQTKHGASVSFPSLKGDRLAAGATVKIFVTKKNATGAYIAYKIKRGNFSKSQSCLSPGTTKVEACP
ncbi:MAG TPA: hypothetical protein VHX88_13430 [Solirubrobacteraceae bacterium]|nr:hypothetical protein [Solirubrobacteraceae bacterium]